MPTMNRLTFFVGLRTRHGGWNSASAAIHTAVVPILAEHGIDGFTVTESVGYWKGQPEKSLTVTTVQPFNCDATAPHEISLALAEALEQECVLYTVEPVTADFVFAPPVAAPAASDHLAECQKKLSGFLKLEEDRLSMLKKAEVPAQS